MSEAQARSSRYLVDVAGIVRAMTANDPQNEASIVYTDIVFSERSGLDVVLDLLTKNPSILLNSEKPGDLLADGRPVKKLALDIALKGLMRLEENE